MKAPKSIWHAGERAIQIRAGVEARADALAKRMVRSHMPEQHREFYQQLPFLLVGYVDQQGYPWATLLEGAPGFLTSPNEHSLTISLSSDSALPQDQMLEQGMALGLLGIDFETRRRNRLNGYIETSKPGQLSLRVAHSYGNCPKYIQKRRVQRSSQLKTSNIVETYGVLTSEDRALIQCADTFFVASYAQNSEQQMEVDLSHRGGAAGFVQLSTAGTLTIPDYSGNRFYNSLGNIYATKRAGLLFIDFEKGTLLQLTGEATLDFSENALSKFENAEHVWDFNPILIRRYSSGTQLRWTNL